MDTETPSKVESEALTEAAEALRVYLYAEHDEPHRLRLRAGLAHALCSTPLDSAHLPLKMLILQALDRQSLRVREWEVLLRELEETAGQTEVLRDDLDGSLP